MESTEKYRIVDNEGNGVLADVSGSYKPLTLSRIEEIVDETKGLTPKEQTAVAYSMPMTACGLYVLKMKSKYGISVAI